MQVGVLKVAAPATGIGLDLGQPVSWQQAWANRKGPIEMYRLPEPKEFELMFIYILFFAPVTSCLHKGCIQEPKWRTRLGSWPGTSSAVPTACCFWDFEVEASCGSTSTSSWVHILLVPVCTPCRCVCVCHRPLCHYAFCKSAKAPKKEHLSKASSHDQLSGPHSVSPSYIYIYEDSSSFITIFLAYDLS